MALPVTIHANVSVGPQNSYHGPFRASDGAFYLIARAFASASSAGVLSLWRATDPTDSFSELDAETIGDSGTEALLSIWCVQEDDTVHIVAQKDGAASTNPHDVYYTSVDLTSTGTFTTEIRIEDLGTDDAGPNAVACSIAVESIGGDLVVVYQGDPDMLMGTEYAQIDANRSDNDGATWGGPTQISDTGDPDHYTGPVIVAGTSDRMHIFFKNDDIEEAFQRRMGSDDSLETFPSAFSATKNAATANYIFGHGVNSSGTIYVPWLDADNETSVVSFTSADTPSYTETNNVSDNDVVVVNSSAAHAIVLDGTDRHLMYSHALQLDIFRDVDTGSGWGTDIEALDAVTVNRVYPNIYDRSGTKLAYIYSDGGAIRYNEVDISVAFTNLSDVKFPDQNYFTGPFDI